MAETAYKRCRDCGAEFQHWVAKCSDCGGELDWAPQAEPEPEPGPPLPPTSELTLLRITDPWDARQLAEALQAAGIPSRVERPPESAVSKGGPADPLRLRETRDLRIGVYVRLTDLAAAAEVETEVVARSSPAIAELAEVAAPDANACPACGAALDPSAPRCAECGLEFPGE